MTTTGPTPSSSEAPKKEHSILDAMKKGREYATAMVLVLTFFHSMYASYFKKEEVAEAGYKTTSEALEGYSQDTHDQIESLKARLEAMELEKLEAQKAAEEAAAQAAAVRPRGQRLPRLAPVPVAAVLRVEVDHDQISDVDLDAPANMQIQMQAPAILDLPEAPWEQKAKD